MVTSKARLYGNPKTNIFVFVITEVNLPIGTLIFYTYNPFTMVINTI